MAISKELWEKARTLYETNQYSLAQISEKTGIDKSTISKKAKIQQWSNVENLDYIEAKTVLAVKKSTLNQQKINTLDDVSDEVIRRKNLVFGALEKAAKRTSQMLDDNVTYEKLNSGNGVQNLEPRELNMQDLELASKTLTNVGKSLGVIEVKPDVAIQNNNITNQIEDEIIITKKGH
jgi:transcriptional regulator with XRE-family HTH domain